MTEEKTASTKEGRDAHINLYRVPRTDEAKAVVGEIVGMIQVCEQVYAMRQRKRRAADLKTFEATATAVLCDVIHRARWKPEGWLAVSRSKRILGRRRDRYTAPLLNKAIPDILTCLTKPELAFIELREGRRGFKGMAPGRLTTIRAAPRLIERLDEHGISLGDLGESLDQETVILKESKDHEFDKGKWIDYPDDDTTRQHRAQLRRINEHLRAADLEFYEDAVSQPADPSDRFIRRYFNNGSFEQGGRVFAGFWQGIKKDERRDALRIDGEQVTILDYSQMGLRIAYAVEGLSAPAGDAYSIPHHKDFPNNLRWPREGVKMLVNALLFSSGPLEQMPRGSRQYFKNRKTKADYFVDQMRAQFPEIAHRFCKAHGFRLMLIESRVLLDVLTTLVDEGITALPIHDAIVVPQSRAARAKAVMLASFRTIVGTEGEVKEQA